MSREKARKEGLYRKYNEATSSYNKGLFQKTVNLIDAQLKRSNNVDFLILKGQSLNELYEPEKALKCFDEVLDKDINNKKAILGKAHTLHKLHKYEAAKELYGNLIDSISQDEKPAKANQTYLTSALIGKATVLSDLESNEEALKCFNEAGAKAYCSIGNFYRKQNNLEEALKYYDQAIAENEQNTSAYIGKGYVFIQQSYSMNVSSSQQQADTTPDNNENGLSEEQKEKINSAIKFFDDAREISKRSAEAYNAKGYALSLMEQNTKAKECFEQALEFKPEYSDALHNKAEILRDEETEKFKTNLGADYHILSDEWYREEDISPIAKKLLDAKCYNSAEEFSVVGSADQLDEFISSYKDSGKSLEQKPIFVIYNKNGKHWVTLCITEDKGQKLVLYKDSFGNKIPFEVEQVIKDNFENIKFKSHTNKEQLDNHSCGPMALKNLEIIIDGLSSSNKDNFIRQFVNTKFTKQEDVSDSKIDFCNIGEVSNKIKEYAEELSNNANFCKALKSDFMPSIEKFAPYIETVTEIQKLREDPLAKSEDEIDYAEIANLVKENLSNLSIKTEGLKENEKNLNKFQDKYAEEFLQFKKIFDLLNRIKNSTEFDHSLDYIADQLGLDNALIKQFYTVQKTQQKSPDEPNIFLETRDISSIEEKTPKESSEEGIKTFDQLLEELFLGNDNAENKVPEKALEDKELKNKLKNLYSQVKENYSAKENWNKFKINQWAKEHKGTLLNDDETICEAISILDQANKIVTGNNLRDSQILAILVFLQTGEDQGRLSEIKTGEGKTTIVSLLATIKALQGETVDIITSNTVLAGEGVTDRGDFYSLFGLTVATNNPDKKEPYINEPKSCYTADVLYGSIGSFQFDYLRDSFEGNGTRAEREFGTVLIDEVDSMLIDNGGHIAKLSGPLPGMESLKYIYIKIWEELKKAFDNKKASIQEAWKKNLEALAEDLDPSKIDNEFESFRSDYLEDSQEEIKEIVKKAVGNLEAEIKLVPAHLKEYAESSIDQWIDNAISAKFVFNEDQQYIIEKQDGEDRVVPVDYENTGVTLKNTIWSNGLHQFVQLKHNLQLTAESLTSCFISNVGYIKKYGNKIFGFTGTLGSSAEQDLLSTMYNLDYAKISTFKEKKLKELTGQVIKDSDWDFEVAYDAIMQCEKGRAVLTICETISDLHAIKEILKNLKKLPGLQNKFQWIEYKDQDDSDATKIELEAGHIIIATNIAGRGTDLKTSKEVEENGGLHVSVGFLPCNQRVEDQAFGRTARQGNNGTCKLMIRESEVQKLDLPSSTLDKVRDEKESIDLMQTIKEKRDQREETRLEQIKQRELPSLKFQDALFTKFSEEYRKFNDKSEGSIDYMFASRDIKEYWAYWLEMNKDRFDKFEFNISNTQNKAAEEFNKFLQDDKVKGLQQGKIEHNPYYAIQKAECLIQQENFSKAKKELDNALELCGESPELMCSAYIKLFNIAIEEGKQLTERFKKMLAKLIFINISKNEDYKKAALENLENAKKALKIKLNYLNTEILNYEKLFPKESNTNQNAQNKDKFDFKEILIATEGENLLLKHLAAEQTGLNLYLQNVESLLAELKKCDGASISSKIPDYFYDYKQKTDAREKEIDKKVKEATQNDSESEQSIRQAITNSDIAEIRAIGLDPIFTIKNIHDVENKVIYAAQGQIAGGLAALSAGIAFPPCMVVMGPIAGALMGEGISDIVFELLNQGEEHDNKEYNQGKAISYAISVATMGIGAAAAGLKILSKASGECKKVVKALRESPKFKTVCKKVADQVEKLGKLFEDMHKAHMEKWNNAKDLYSLQKLQKAGKLDEFGVKQLKELKSCHSSLVKNVGKSVVQDAISTALMEGLFNPNLQLLVSEIVKKLEGKIAKKVEEEIDSDLLTRFVTEQLTKENNNAKNIEDIINETLDQAKDDERATNISQEIASGMIRGTDHTGAIRGSKAIAKSLHAISGLVDSILTAEKLKKYPEDFCSKFNDKLKENAAINEFEATTISIENRKDGLQKAIKSLLKDQFKEFLLEYILYEDTFNALKEKLLSLFEQNFQADIKKLVDEHFQNEQIKDLSDKQFDSLIEKLPQYFALTNPQKSYFDFCITTDELGHLAFIKDQVTFTGTVEESFNECNNQLEKYYGNCLKERTADEVDIQHNVISAKEYIKETILGEFTGKITGFISKYSNTYVINPMIHKVLNFKFKKVESNETQHLVPKELHNPQDLSSEHGDHLRELEVRPGASYKETRKNFLKLCLEHHPDKVKGNDEHAKQLRLERTEKQKKLNLAWAALTKDKDQALYHTTHNHDDTNVQRPTTESSDVSNTVKTPQPNSSQEENTNRPTTADLAVYGADTNDHQLNSGGLNDPVNDLSNRLQGVRITSNHEYGNSRGNKRPASGPLVDTSNQKILKGEFNNHEGLLKLINCPLTSIAYATNTTSQNVQKEIPRPSGIRIHEFKAHLLQKLRLKNHNDICHFKEECISSEQKDQKTWQNNVLDNIDKAVFSRAKAEMDKTEELYLCFNRADRTGHMVNIELADGGRIKIIDAQTNKIPTKQTITEDNLEQYLRNQNVVSVHLLFPKQGAPRYPLDDLDMMPQNKQSTLKVSNHENFDPAKNPEILTMVIRPGDGGSSIFFVQGKYNDPDQMLFSGGMQSKIPGTSEPINPRWAEVEKSLAQQGAYINHPMEMRIVAEGMPIYPNNQSAAGIEKGAVVNLQVKEFNKALFMLKQKGSEVGVMSAYNCPFLRQDTDNFVKLQENSVTVPLHPEANEPKLMVTGTFSGCSLIIGVGEYDLKIFHDGRPADNKEEKIKGIASEHRHIMRLDHADNAEESAHSHSYTMGTPSGGVHKVTMFLCYNNASKKWELTKQRVSETITGDSISISLESCKTIEIPEYNPFTKLQDWTIDILDDNTHVQSQDFIIDIIGDNDYGDLPTMN